MQVANFPEDYFQSQECRGKIRTPYASEGEANCHPVANSRERHAFFPLLSERYNIDRERMDRYGALR